MPRKLFPLSSSDYIGGCIRKLAQWGHRAPHTLVRLPELFSITIFEKKFDIGTYHLAEIQRSMCNCSPTALQAYLKDATE
jgi:hypothetical protein